MLSLILVSFTASHPLANLPIPPSRLQRLLSPVAISQERSGPVVQGQPLRWVRLCGASQVGPSGIMQNLGGGSLPPVSLSPSLISQLSHFPSFLPIHPPNLPFICPSPSSALCFIYFICSLHFFPMENQKQLISFSSPFYPHNFVVD